MTTAPCPGRAGLHGHPHPEYRTWPCEPVTHQLKAPCRTPAQGGHDLPDRMPRYSADPLAASRHRTNAVTLRDQSAPSADAHSCPLCLPGLCLGMGWPSASSCASSGSCGSHQPVPLTERTGSHVSLIPLTSSCPSGLMTQLGHRALTAVGASAILSNARLAPRHVVRQRGYLCHLWQ